MTCSADLLLADSNVMIFFGANQRKVRDRAMDIDQADGCQVSYLSIQNTRISPVLLVDDTTKGVVGNCQYCNFW